ncbi:hypothetical protein OG21DRAFT_1525162, partial [Imleria badia]
MYYRAIKKTFLCGYFDNDDHGSWNLAHPAELFCVTSRETLFIGELSDLGLADGHLPLRVQVSFQTVLQVVQSSITSCAKVKAEIQLMKQLRHPLANEQPSHAGKSFSYFHRSRAASRQWFIVQVSVFVVKSRQRTPCSILKISLTCQSGTSGEPTSSKLMTLSNSHVSKLWRFYMIPLFGVLQTEVEDTEWAEESAHRVGELFCALSDAALTAAGHDTQLEAGIIRIAPFKLQHHQCGRGRPAFEFNQEWLANAETTNIH